MSKKRIQATLRLNDDIRRVRQVSDARAKVFARLGVYTVRDLLLYAPFRYIDFTDIVPISHTNIGEKATVVGTVDNVTSRRARNSGISLVQFSVVDDTGVINVTFFNQPWLIDKIKNGDNILIQGSVEHYSGYKQIASPIYRVLDKKSTSITKLGIQPVYRCKQGLTSNMISKAVYNALEEISPFIVDPIEAPLRIEDHISSRQNAIFDLHFPKKMKDVDIAKRRLAYEEMLLLQLHWLGLSGNSNVKSEYFSHKTDGPHLNSFLSALPYRLTEDQKNAIDDVLKDMSDNTRMNRLVLGDVGTGKTTVASAAIACVCDSNTQAALMAPTEVLCKQYCEKLGGIFDEIGISWACLTSSSSSSERAEILKSLKNLETSVLFSTHAVLEEDVVFNNLTLAIVDEQHRFGVAQREKLKNKGKFCDYLCMTATPIPRSLALTIYGTLECSYIMQRPLANKSVKTKVIDKKNRFIAFDAIREAVAKGRQAYIVCPLIGTSENISLGCENKDLKRPENDEDNQNFGEEDEVAPLTEFDFDFFDENLAAAKKEAEYLQNQVFPDLKIGQLTGAMPSKEKEECMKAFRNGEYDILVATTVVEVGIDVPNATVMVIEDAQRFGLSQLHQLRGRVGRGEFEGQAFLIANTNTEQSEKRMSYIESTQDGFKLSELDLSLRKEGDVVGSKQHGIPTLRFTNVIRDAKLIEKARADAKRILRDDPQLNSGEHILLKHELFALYDDKDFA